MKRVILSSNISHYNYTARALKRMGILKKYITGAQFSEVHSFFKYLPKNVKEHFIYRTDENLKGVKLYSLWKLEVLYKLALKLLKKQKEKVILCHNYLFDKIAAKQVEDCDIFHFVSSIGLTSAKKAKQKGAKIIVDERAIHPIYLEKILKEEYNYLNIKRDIEVYTKNILLKEYDLGDYFIVASEFAKRTFVEQGIDKNKIFVVPYGFDNTKFYPEKKKDDVFRVIYVGRISIAKGVHYLIEAFNKLEFFNKELILIGKIESESYINIKSPKIKHFSYIPNNQLRKYYSNSSVFVLPSLYDSFGLVVLEAMACGLPVIVTENVGASDFIKEENGFVVPIRDANAIYEKLKYLSSNKDLLEYMQKNNISVSNQYNWNNYMKRLEEVYNTILYN